MTDLSVIDNSLLDGLSEQEKKGTTRYTIKIIRG